jgi:hypothetical protein
MRLLFWLKLASLLSRSALSSSTTSLTAAVGAIVGENNVGAMGVVLGRIKKDQLPFEQVFIKALPGLAKIPETEAEGYFHTLVYM